MSEIDKILYLRYETNRDSQISYRLIIDGESNDGTKEMMIPDISKKIELSKMKKDIRVIFSECIGDGYTITLTLTDKTGKTIHETPLRKGDNCFLIQRQEDDDISIEMEYYSEESAQNSQAGGTALTAQYIEQCLKKESVTPQVGAMLKQYERVLSFICLTEDEKVKYEGKLDALQAKIAAQDDCEGYIDEVNALREEMKDMIAKDRDRVHSYQLSK